MKTNGKTTNGKATNDKLIDKLNSLVEINNDRIEGYEKAEKDTKDNDLKNLFKEMADRSRALKSELSDKIRALGGVPADGTRTSGKIFRAWMDIKAALTNKDRKAILSACETGEDAAVEAYEDVLKSGNTFTPEIRALVENQEREINRYHDRIKDMRDTEKKGQLAEK